MVQSDSSSDCDTDLSFMGIAYNPCDSSDLSEFGKEDCSEDSYCHYEECCCGW